MTRFFQSFFGSCLGVLCSLLLVSLVGVWFISNAISESDASLKVKSNTVLQLNLNQAIPEKTDNITSSNPYSLQIETVLGLQDIIEALENAKEDNKIKGIYLNLSSTPIGRATATEVRDALLDFKESGKFIYAYGDNYSQGAYFMASAADEIYLNPIGAIDFRGFGVQLAFYKNLLERLGVKMQVFYAGEFKSATEPYRRSEMSDQNRMQVKEYMGDLYRLYLEAISKSRKISVQELERWSNNYTLRDADDALEHKLIDVLGYEDETRDKIREKLGLSLDDKLNLITLNEYHKGNTKSVNYKIKDKIAIVYSEGEIVYGSGKPGMISSNKYVKILRKIRADDRVKAVVIRINSPGGSALASERIWREIERIKESGRPVIASMGDVAASGGYYIACGADSIFAEPATITGSIGVYSFIPSIQKMLDEKVGITFDTVKTGTFAIGLNPFMDISEAESAIMQESTEQIYETFLQRVADGRKMSRDEVHQVARGRVWTGERALNNGLVDAIGGLDVALQVAADRAGIEDYRLAEYPKAKEPFEQFIDQFTGTESQMKRQSFIEEELGDFYPFYENLKMMQRMKGAQARLPYLLSFE